MFEITVQAGFSSGHYLRNYHGKCENPHGHNYRVLVTLAGAELDEAGMLLDFFLEEIGPLIYNAAITDAQTRLQRNVSDLSGDLYEKPFSYWPRVDAKRKPRR